MSAHDKHAGPLAKFSECVAIVSAWRFFRRMDYCTHDKPGSRRRRRARGTGHRQTRRARAVSDGGVGGGRGGDERSPGRAEGRGTRRRGGGEGVGGAEGSGESKGGRGGRQRTAARAGSSVLQTSSLSISQTSATCEIVARRRVLSFRGSCSFSLHAAARCILIRGGSWCLCAWRLFH